MSSSYDQYPDIGVDLYDLETILIDPALRSVLHKSVEINEQASKEGGMEKVRAARICEMLDAELRELSAMEQCVVSGRLSRFVPGEDESHLVTNERVDDLSACNKGFYAVPLHGEDWSAPHFGVAMMFEYEDRDAGELRIGHMMPEKINALTYPDVISLEQASALLRYYTPKLLQQINDKIGSDSTDEIGAVERLHDVICDIDVGGIEPMRLAKALNVYAAQAITFDRQVPYAIKVTSDRVIEQSADEFILVEMDVDQMLVEIKGLCFMPAPDEPDSSTVMPYLEIDTVSLYKEQPVQNIFVPVAAIDDIRSMRRQYYSDVEIDTSE